jgi:hypothetical protein
MTQEPDCNRPIHATDPAPAAAAIEDRRCQTQQPWPSCQRHQQQLRARVTDRQIPNITNCADANPSYCQQQITHVKLLPEPHRIMLQHLTKHGRFHSCTGTTQPCADNCTRNAHVHVKTCPCANTQHTCAPLMTACTCFNRWATIHNMELDNPTGSQW